MPPQRKISIKDAPYLKKVIILALLLTITAIGLLLGIFVTSRTQNKIFKATFVSNTPVAVCFTV